MITGVTGTTEGAGRGSATPAIPGTEPEPGPGISRITYREPASFQDAFLAKALEEAKKLDPNNPRVKNIEKELEGGGEEEEEEF